MVRVKFTDKTGRVWTATFPKKTTLRDVRFTAKKINPKITKVEYHRPKKKRKTGWLSGSRW